MNDWRRQREASRDDPSHWRTPSPFTVWIRECVIQNGSTNRNATPTHCNCNTGECPHHEVAWTTYRPINSAGTTLLSGHDGWKTPITSTGTTLVSGLEGWKTPEHHYPRIVTSEGGWVWRGWGVCWGFRQYVGGPVQRWYNWKHSAEAALKIMYSQLFRLVVWLHWWQTSEDRDVCYWKLVATASP